MPQINFQYSSNLNIDFDFEDLFFPIHQILVQKAGIDINNCKSRALKMNDYFVGNGEKKHGFIHCELSLLEGKPKEIKKEIGESILGLIRKSIFEKNKHINLQITLEIREMARNHYFKFPEGTLSKP